jgi:hypothetical protein
MPHQHSDNQAAGASHAPRFLVVSGGTGCNAICSAFDDACYVLPVSDDGGSSSEIIRVLGGPSIGAALFPHISRHCGSYWVYAQETSARG